MNNYKLIVLGKEFFNKTHKEQVDHLHKLASSLNHALDLMQKERNGLKEQYTFLETQLHNCQQALDIQKEIVRTTLTEDNQLKQNYIEEIQELKGRVKTQDQVIEDLNASKI